MCINKMLLYNIRDLIFVKSIKQSSAFILFIVLITTTSVSYENADLVSFASGIFELFKQQKIQASNFKITVLDVSLSAYFKAY